MRQNSIQNDSVLKVELTEDNAASVLFVSFACNPLKSLLVPPCVDSNEEYHSKIKSLFSGLSPLISCLFFSLY